MNHSNLLPRNFVGALTDVSGVAIIAEYKRASPSLGDINLDIEVEDVVSHYVALGASALSILTDKERFKGDLSFIARAKAVCDLPVLRKDFITTEQQLEESVVAGADAVLLIVADLTSNRLQQLVDYAHSLGLQTLVETHTAEEVAIALPCKPTMLGINSRNLTTLEINTDLFTELAPLVPADQVLVAESGLSLETAPALQQYGFSAALIGTSLMKQL